MRFTKQLLAIYHVFPLSFTVPATAVKNEEDTDNISISEPRPRSIKFCFDDQEALKTGSRLARAPTPYPKELRALAKHARNLSQARTSVGSGEEGVVTVVGRRESREEATLLQHAQPVDSTEGEGIVTLNTLL